MAKAALSSVGNSAKESLLAKGGSLTRSLLANGGAAGGGGAPGGRAVNQHSQLEKHLASTAAGADGKERHQTIGENMKERNNAGQNAGQDYMAKKEAAQNKTNARAHDPGAQNSARDRRHQQESGSLFGG